MSATFVAIDTETTGVGPDARIVEIAAVRYVDGVEHARFFSLINPGIPIPEKASAVNGITDAMVADAPPVDVVLPGFLTVIGNDDLVGHNIEFDLRMLRQEIDRIWRRLGNEHSITNEWACTLGLARKHLKLASYKLGAVAEHLGVVVEGAHRALADALTAGRIFLLLDAIQTWFPCLKCGEMVAPNSNFTCSDCILAIDREEAVRPAPAHEKAGEG